MRCGIQNRSVTQKISKDPVDSVAIELFRKMVEYYALYAKMNPNSNQITNFSHTSFDQWIE